MTPIVPIFRALHLLVSAEQDFSVYFVIFVKHTETRDKSISYVKIS